MFLDASGGTGKTFLLQLILSTVLMREGGIAIATASTKLPINIETIDNPIANIPKESNVAQLSVM